MFSDLEEAVLAYQDGQVALHAKVKLRWEGQIIDTTVGRVLFNLVLPDEVRFVNELIDKGRLSNLITKVYRVCGHARTVELLDALKTLGFEWATRAGMSIAVKDLVIPPDKNKILGKAHKEVEQVESQYRLGLITDG